MKNAGRDVQLRVSVRHMRDVSLRCHISQLGDDQFKRQQTDGEQMNSTGTDPSVRLIDMLSLRISLLRARVLLGSGEICL